GREWLEVERAEAPSASPPRRPLVRELGPRKDKYEERQAVRPIEEVLDEVEQARVRPLHVLEHEDRRPPLGEPLEQDAPSREEILLIADRSCLKPEQMS